jgi:hypothetical protein
MGYSTGTWAAKKIVALSASADEFPVCRGLLVGTAGTATVTDAEGNSISNIPLQAGYNPIQIKKLTALGTASGVYALY